MNHDYPYRPPPHKYEDRIDGYGRPPPYGWRPPSGAPPPGGRFGDPYGDDYPVYLERERQPSPPPPFYPLQSQFSPRSNQVLPSEYSISSKIAEAHRRFPPFEVNAPPLISFSETWD